MNKREVAHALQTMGALLEIKGEDRFKVRSYEKAAQSLLQHDYDLPAMAREGRLTEIPGIGKNLEPKVRDLILTGRSPFLERLVQEVPEGILDLLRVPGIGPKTARMLHSSLGIASLSDLERALAEHRIQGLPGMGKKREDLMGKGLSEIRKYEGRLSLGIALPVLEDLVATLASMDIHAEITGETRRYEETVGSLDVLVREEEGEEPWDTLFRSGILHVENAAQLRGNWDSERFTFSTSFGVPLRVSFSPRGRFGLSCAELTGPPSFADALARKMRKKGYRPSRDGLHKGDSHASVSSEEALFRAIDVFHLPPELRHRDELVRAALCNESSVKDRLQCLVSPEDIRGDLHVHTTWSDGTASIEEMVAAAIEMGYSYIAITDHATEIRMIRGITPARMAEQIEEIRRLRTKYPRIRILTGVEVDILRDGRLYLEDDLLSQLDVVVASVHQDVSGSRGELQDRLLKAIANPNVDILGHVTGRIIGRRPGVSESLEDVFEAAAAQGVALEVNGSPERLDLPERLAADAVRRGARLAACTDAHSTDALRSMGYAVFAVCRRAGITKGSVVNAKDYVSRS